MLTLKSANLILGNFMKCYFKIFEKSTFMYVPFQILKCLSGILADFCVWIMQ